MEPTPVATYLQISSYVRKITLILFDAYILLFVADDILTDIGK